MNENASSSFVVGLLFVLRCLIPLGILFGISYLLRRWELVTANSDEVLMVEMEEQTAKMHKAPQGTAKEHAKTPAKKKTDGKKKSSPSKRKEK